MSNSEKSNLTRYKQLIDRTLIDLKLARDVAKALKLPGTRIQRLTRARTELIDEQIEANMDTAEKRLQGSTMNFTTSEARAQLLVERAEKHKSRKQLREEVADELRLIQSDMQQRCAHLAKDAGRDDIAVQILNLKVK